MADRVFAMTRRVVAMFVIALLSSTLPTGAQLVTGSVIEAGSERPVAGAAIEARDTTGLRRAAAVSDTAGVFRLLMPQPGRYFITVSHIGYATAPAAAIDAGLGVEVQLELRMSPTALQLEPLRVVGRTAFNTGWLTEYYDRAVNTRRSGMGRVFFRDEVERANVPYVSVFLNHLQPRGTCRPTLFLDGLEVDDAQQLNGSIQPDQLEGVELYNNQAFLPPRYANRGHCAIALFWTRRDMEGGRPLTWRRVIAAGGLVAALFLLLQL